MSAALHAFGEAIATIARAQMVGRVAAGQIIVVDFGVRMIELWSYGGSLCVSERSALSPCRLCEIEGNFVDVVVEVVVVMIEECER